MKYRIINRTTNEVMATFPGDQKGQAERALKRIIDTNKPYKFLLIEVARMRMPRDPSTMGSER